MTSVSPSSSLLSIDWQRSGERVVMTAVGEIDVSTVDALRHRLESARQGGAAEIWLDLTDTTFIDCRGLHALLDLHAGVVEADRRLVLVCPAGPVRRLLDLTGADDKFEIRSTAPPLRRLGVADAQSQEPPNP